MVSFLPSELCCLWRTQSERSKALRGLDRDLKRREVNAGDTFLDGSSHRAGCCWLGGRVEEQTEEREKDEETHCGRRSCDRRKKLTSKKKFSGQETEL